MAEDSADTADGACTAVEQDLSGQGHRTRNTTHRGDTTRAYTPRAAEGQGTKKPYSKGGTHWGYGAVPQVCWAESGQAASGTIANVTRSHGSNQ